MASALTVVLPRPVFTAFQLPPQLTLLNTPPTVAAYRIAGFAGLTAIARTAPPSGPWLVQTSRPARAPSGASSATARRTATIQPTRARRGVACRGSRRTLSSERPVAPLGPGRPALIPRPCGRGAP